MADIAAGNVTYSFDIKDRSFLGKMGFLNIGSITFGTGSLTYPSGGVPVTKAKCGAPRRLRAMKIFESNATGYQFEYDVSAETIRIFQTKTLTPVGTLSSNSAGTPSGNLSSNSAGTPAGNVAAPTITILSAGSNAAANAAIFVNAGALSHNVANASSVTGVQAPVFTGAALAGHSHDLTGDALADHAHSFTGTATTASVLSELSGGSSAVAACVLQVEVLGY